VPNHRQLRIAPAIDGMGAMSITTVRCHVLGSRVMCLRDLEGAVTRVICPSFEPATGLCRLRREALCGGPLSQLMERVAEDTLSTRDARCELQ
jgi:hypothetical protein